jgi:hypothetical protein
MKLKHKKPFLIDSEVSLGETDRQAVLENLLLPLALMAESVVDSVADGLQRYGFGMPLVRVIYVDYLLSDRPNQQSGTHIHP